MTCDELLAYLSRYIDHDLDDELTASAREHLSTCRNCTVVLDTTKRTILLGKGEAQRMMPPERRGLLFERLQAAFLQRPRGVQSS